MTAEILKGDNVGAASERAMEAGEGLLRLTPTWVPRSFLHPGNRIKLHPDDLYAYGADRGGIDERWFGSTTEAANEGRVWNEGLSFVLSEGKTAATRSVEIENTGSEPLVVRHYFGPNTHDSLPSIGDYHKAN